jgi:serine/threonine protein kinase
MASLIGKSLGRYHILEQLGEGGMATVYKAFDTRLEREVAIKVVRRKAFPEEKIERILKRFDREAKALAKLNHANIIPIIDSGEEDGTPYLVMGYIPGGTLKEKLKGKPIPWQEVAQLLAPIAHALAYSHKQNIVHRDIKPSNILITENGQLMLTDFGIARVLQAEETLDLTGTGMGVGTPEYMAPEQGLGHKVDHRADIYALGIIFYEMVTGRKPFQADTPMAVVIKQINDPLPRPTQFVPDLPKDVEKTLLKALAKDPKNRYQRMGEFALALEKLADRQGKVVPIRRKPARDRHKKTKKITIPSKTLRWITLGLVGIALIFGASRLIDINQMAELFPTSTPTYTSTATLVKTAVPSATLQITSTPRITTTPTLTATPALGVGSTWVRPADGMTMMYIPAGEFEMGQADGNYGETPVHTVFLDAFWIDKNEVTNELYQKCVEAGFCEENQPELFNADEGGSFGVGMSWFHGNDYCKWVGGRLPTEAEWEKAARGSLVGKKYPWGDILECLQGEAYGSHEEAGCKVTEMGSLRLTEPNGYGLYEMAGGNWEWVFDWYNAVYYYNSPYENPLGPIDGKTKVLRGGGGSLADTFRVSYRGQNSPVTKSGNISFRCVVDLSPEE